MTHSRAATRRHLHRASRALTAERANEWNIGTLINDSGCGDIICLDRTISYQSTIRTVPEEPRSLVLSDVRRQQPSQAGHHRRRREVGIFVRCLGAVYPDRAKAEGGGAEGIPTVRG